MQRIGSFISGERVLPFHFDKHTELGRMREAAEFMVQSNDWEPSLRDGEQLRNNEVLRVRPGLQQRNIDRRRAGAEDSRAGRSPSRS